jgi:hypothetical protein
MLFASSETSSKVSVFCSLSQYICFMQHHLSFGVFITQNSYIFFRIADNKFPLPLLGAPEAPPVATQRKEVLGEKLKGSKQQLPLSPSKHWLGLSSE